MRRRTGPPWPSDAEDPGKPVAHFRGWRLRATALPPAGSEGLRTRPCKEKMMSQLTLWAERRFNLLPPFRSIRTSMDWVTPTHSGEPLCFPPFTHSNAILLETLTHAQRKHPHLLARSRGHVSHHHSLPGRLEDGVRGPGQPGPVSRPGQHWRAHS